MKAFDDLLHLSPWWPRLDATQQARVRDETLVRDIEAGAMVCQRGVAVEHWIGIIDGLAKMSNVSFEGKSVTLTGIPAGGWFGEGSLLKNEPRRYDVVALRATRAAYVPARLFHWLLDNNIAFNRFLLLQLNERLGQFIGLLETERLLGPEARVARCIAQLFNPLLYPRTGARLQISQNELGLLTGLSRQRVNQAVRRLEAEALLSVEYGSVTVVSLAGLAGYDG